MKTTLRTLIQSPRVLGLGLAVVGLLALLIVWRAPAEKSLGDGIRWVYLHVGLIWTGMAALAAAGVLGVVMLATGRPWFQGWTRIVGLVGLGFFAAGWALSMAAAQANWGGLFWDEPRNRVNLQVLAAGVIVVAAGSWLSRSRWQGVPFSLLFVWMLGSFSMTPLVLHPRSPIFSSSSGAIQATFLSLFLLFSLGALGLILHLQLRNTASPERQ